MIMGIWRDLTAFVLLAHLVMLSRGNIKGKGRSEEILAKNVSIIVIEDKANSPEHLEKLRNATSLGPEYNNLTVALNTTEVVDKNEFVVELEEALVSAASLGQVILIAPPANRPNTFKSLPGSVTVIETPVNKSKSLVEEVIGEKNKKRNAINPSFDQEIAQSQKIQRAGSYVYTDDEALETLDDLLAITEYEPQRIDAKRIDESIAQVTGDDLNSTLESTSRSEDTHYDVPKQRNPPRNYQRISDFGITPLNKSLNEASSEIVLKMETSDLHPTQTIRWTTTSNPPRYKVEEVKPTAPTIFDGNISPKDNEISRASRNSEIIIPLTTKPSTPRKFTYSKVARRNSLHGEPSSIDTTSTLVPDMPGSTKTPLRNIYNLTNISNLRKKKLHLSRVPATPVSLPSTYYPFLQQEAYSVHRKKSTQSTLPTSAVLRASKRSDHYLSPDYVTSTNGKLEPSTNRQLGYLMRYNKPSLVTRQVPKARLYPAASEYRQTEASKESLETKRIDDEDNYEETKPESSRSVTPVRDSFESGRRNLSSQLTISKPSFIDYQKDHQPEQPIDDYRNDRRAAIVKITPAYESYEEDDEESAVQKSEEVRSHNELLLKNKNSFVASTTTPAYDSYELEKAEKSNTPQQPKFITTGEQRQRMTTSSDVVPSRQVYQSYDYFGKPLQSATKSNLVNNPIYQLHGVKTNSNPVAANTIYHRVKNNQETRPSTAGAPLERPSTRYLPRVSDINQRIVTTTDISDSHGDSEEPKSPPVTTHRLRNPNFVDHNIVRAHYDVDNNNQNKVEVTTIFPTRKQNTKYAYDEPIRNQYSLYQAKSGNKLPLVAPFNSQRDAPRFATRVTTSTYVENNGSNEDVSNDDRSDVPAATKLQTMNRPNNLEPVNTEIRWTAAPNYKSYSSNTANYGSRVRPRISREENINVVPSSTHTSLTAPSRSRNVEMNYGSGRRASVHVKEESDESVHRADVKEAPYEDKIQTSLGHAEDQVTHHTHAKVKKHGEVGGGDNHHEEGGGVKHEQDHHEAHGEKGDKGYKGYHEYDKANKGHHEKERHDKEYDEKKGEKKKHVDEGSYHKEQHHVEKGDKEAEFAEKGEHQKGHSTKGQHIVHKKDEYVKKTEFYDESHEDDGEEKEGEYHHEHEHKKGGHEKKGHHDLAHEHDNYGEKGDHEKGQHYHEKNGHDGKAGKEQHHHNHEKYGKNRGHEKGFKWSHTKGDDEHGGGEKKSS